MGTRRGDALCNGGRGHTTEPPLRNTISHQACGPFKTHSTRGTLVLDVIGKYTKLVGTTLELNIATSMPPLRGQPTGYINCTATNILVYISLCPSNFASFSNLHGAREGKRKIEKMILEKGIINADKNCKNV